MIKYITESNKEFKELLNKLDPFSSEIFFDLETTGLDTYLDKILLAQFMIDDLIYVLNVPKLGLGNLSFVMEMIKEHNIKVIAHNAKFDWKFIFHHTKVKLNNVFDTMNAECILNAGIGSSTYSLEELVLKYTGEQLSKEIRESFFNGQATEDFTELQILYSANDVRVMKPVYLAQIKRAKESKEFDVLNMEMGIIPVVAKMEYDGVLLDKGAWSNLEQIAIKKAERYKPVFKRMVIGKADLSKYKNAFEVRKAFAFPKNIAKRDKETLESITDANVIKGWIFENFNIGSNQQVKQALNNIGIQVKNTNAKYLEMNFKGVREIEALLKIREQEKRASSFGSNLFSRIHPVTGRIHAEFLNNGAATGRMSYSYHNIPRMKEYRNAFLIARDGWSIITADYSQAEFRLAGAVSGEENIINAYKAGKDMHAATAALQLHKDIHDITKQERNYGKTLNFAILYGTTAYGLQYNLQIKQHEAQKILDVFYAGYPKFAKFKEVVEEKIVEFGYSTTIMGRRRYMAEKPMFMDTKEYSRWLAKQKRELFNHIIQGGSADSVKLSMLNIWNENPFGDKLRILLQEHDELVLEAHNSIAKDAEQFVIETMKKSFQWMLGEIPAEVESFCLPYWTK